MLSSCKTSFNTT